MTPRLSIVVAVLNSHEIVRRQLRFFERMPLPDGIEILYMDDGSDPPLDAESPGVAHDDLVRNGLEALGDRFRIIPTHDTRPWTWAVARNSGAKLARAPYLLMTDIDYILPK